MSQRQIVVIGLCATLAAACASPPTRPPESAPPPEPNPSIAEKLAPPPPCLQIIRLEVWKQERRLRAYCKRGAIIEMSVALGRQELGTKQRVGDHRTPEGHYRVAEEARPGRFHLFIPIDYPSREDAEAALADGRLSHVNYQKIIEAHEHGSPPPHDTELGGDLGFHGEGERWQGDSRYIDWTYGCIAVTDDEIEFISERIEPGVPVWIHP